MKRVAVFGGSFNPPHLGHIMSARSFAEVINADKVIIIPSAIPPHKEQTDFTEGDDRLRMCELAFASLPNAEISDIEIKRGGKSYTYVTLEELHSADSMLYFLVGTDMLLTIDEWKCPEKIFEYASICYVRREDDKNLSRAVEKKIKYLKETYGINIIAIEQEALEISSTKIRDMIKAGEDASSFLSPEVYEYIRHRGLYS